MARWLDIAKNGYDSKFILESWLLCLEKNQQYGNPYGVAALVLPQVRPQVYMLSW